MLSHKAAATAVVVAFVVGILGSLALRPPGGNATVIGAEEGSVPLRVNWRLPVAFQSTMPVLGDNPIYVTKMLAKASGARFS